MDLIRVAIAVYPGKAGGLSLGKAGKGGGNLGVIGRVAPADPVRIAGIAEVEPYGCYLG